MRIAIVTGASSGMGREFVIQIDRMYKELDEIWVLARRRERLEALKELVSSKIRIIEGDLLKENIYEELKKNLQEKQPAVRMLVNSAGFGKTGTVLSLEERDQAEMVQLNCKALTQMTCICLPYMGSGSRIINLASASAFCPQPGFSVYAATKAYVLSFSRSLRIELKQKGMVVTAVCPGPVKTEFFDVCGKKEKNTAKDAVTVNPEAVVKKALIDAKNKKEVSVYGIPMKGIRVMTKLIPHRIILKWMQFFW